MDYRAEIGCPVWWCDVKPGRVEPRRNEEANTTRTSLEEVPVCDSRRPTFPTPFARRCRPRAARIIDARAHGGRVSNPSCPVWCDCGPVGKARRTNRRSAAISSHSALFAAPITHCYRHRTSGTASARWGIMGGSEDCSVHDRALRCLRDDLLDPQGRDDC